ncbi:Zn-ribbon domain-containing OB-fold protein [Chloroflexota bacterium]
MDNYVKPIPQVDEETREFWAGCKKHQLLIQRCEACGTFRFPPRSMCHECGSSSTIWFPASGKGSIYSYTITHRGPARFEVPFAVVLVDLEGIPGVRLPTNIIGCDLKSIRIGMPIKIVYNDITDQISLPKVKPC